MGWAQNRIRLIHRAQSIAFLSLSETMKVIMTWGAILKMKVGRPTHSPLGPSLLTVYAIASNMCLYGSFPLASGTYFWSLVLALSNGKLMVAATPPAKKLARRYEAPGLFGSILPRRSFASSYVVNIPRLRAIALTIVGLHPFQRPRTPSSAGILLAASKNDL